MTTREAIREELESHKMETRFTSEQMAKLICMDIGYFPDNSEVTQVFRDLMDSHELDLLKIRENGKYRYLRSKKNCHIVMHNALLNRDQMRKERRKKLTLINN